MLLARSPPESIVAILAPVAVLECFSSKSLDWNAPIWFASLDLPKAFDRIEYSRLFDALLQQGVPRCYCTLLWKLTKGQTGSVQGSEGFTIELGVKQGDVISPILFLCPKWAAARQTGSKSKNQVQHWNMICKNGRRNCFIMGYNLGMVSD